MQSKTKSITPERILAAFNILEICSSGAGRPLKENQVEGENGLDHESRLRAVCLCDIRSRESRKIVDLVLSSESAHAIEMAEIVTSVSGTVVTIPALSAPTSRKPDNVEKMNMLQAWAEKALDAILQTIEKQQMRWVHVVIVCDSTAQSILLYSIGRILFSENTYGAHTLMSEALKITSEGTDQIFFVNMVKDNLKVKTIKPQNMPYLHPATA